ncbi:NAD(P)/FAD-dependent oxidoreductase [Kiloniella sp.]|uniref:NAD(P)/FAD-dependent oxidoreductase n=1 Tax=Kiloniella sp. TaxID=1938587 RepID=UPI003B025AE5
MSQRIVIIGAGHCGGRVAEHMRKRGFRGSISLIGTERHAPYERPPLSKAVLSKAAPSGSQEGWDPESITLLSPDQLAAQEIDWIGGRTCIDIDPEQQEVVLDSNQRLKFDALVLATGGSPIKLPLAGAGQPQVMYLRTRNDAKALEAQLSLGKKVVVIGAGFIGLEVAAAAKMRGCTVTVLEAGARPLARGLPAETTEAISELHTQHGVIIRNNVAATSFEGSNGKLKRVVLLDDETLSADLVVVGVGIRPNTELAHKAGLSVKDGIQTDAFGRTSHPAIWAAGDCANAQNSRYNRAFRLESWKNAELMAEVVAQDIMSAPEIQNGHAQQYGIFNAPQEEAKEPEQTTESVKLENNAVPWLWSDQFDYGLQTTGFPAEGDEIITRIDGDLRIDFALSDGKLIGAAGLAPGTKAARDIRLVQMMLEQGISPTPEDLANPARKLKALLKGK